MIYDKSVAGAMLDDTSENEDEWIYIDDSEVNNMGKKKQLKAELDAAKSRLCEANKTIEFLKDTIDERAFRTRLSRNLLEEYGQDLEFIREVLYPATWIVVANKA